jgi:hypothetical protein
MPTPPVIVGQVNPYPPIIGDPGVLPPQLAYNRAMAERYAAQRRGMVEWQPAPPVYVAPVGPPPAPQTRYRRLEIIGRVPGW